MPKTSLPSWQGGCLKRGAVQALNAPDIRERFTQLGFVIIGNTPEAFAAVVKSETEKFRRVIVEAGIQVE